jgi:DNA-binding transcriptional LysR family regulator
MHFCMDRNACNKAQMDWDLLRTFEAVARLGSLTAAARALGLSQSTVSRQLDRLEAAADSPLLLRETPVRLTERGDVLLAAVRPMVDAALAAQAALEETPELTGEITVATVGEIVRWVLVRELPSFYRAYPGLRLRILADNRVASLAAGEADVALRFVRPHKGELVARRLHTVTYGFFAAARLKLRPDVPWLGLAGSLADIPEQRYAERAFSRPAHLLVEDVESLGLAVEAGLGVAVLSKGQAQRLKRVIEISPRALNLSERDPGPPPARSLFAVVHQAKHRLPKIRAFLDWLTTLPSLRIPPP